MSGDRVFDELKIRVLAIEELAEIYDRHRRSESSTGLLVIARKFAAEVKTEQERRREAKAR